MKCGALLLALALLPRAGRAETAPATKSNVRPGRATAKKKRANQRQRVLPLALPPESQLALPAAPRHVSDAHEDDGVAELVSRPAAPMVAQPPAPRAATAKVRAADDTGRVGGAERPVVRTAEPAAESAPAVRAAETAPAPSAAESAPTASAAESAPAAHAAESAPTAHAAESAPADLGFDLLGAPAAAKVDAELEQKIGARRALLTLHQGVGFALVGAMAGTMISGQLNYLDRFGGPSTGRYEGAHTVLAAATIGTFAATGLLAYFAPVPIARERQGIDRVAVHELGMIGATVGMVAEATLGILTAKREGFANQSSLAGAHLAIGYATFAFMSVALGALVF